MSRNLYPLRKKTSKILKDYASLTPASVRAMWLATTFSLQHNTAKYCSTCAPSTFLSIWPRAAYSVLASAAMCDLSWFSRMQLPNNMCPSWASCRDILQCSLLLRILLTSSPTKFIVHTVSVFHSQSGARVPNTRHCACACLTTILSSIHICVAVLDYSYLLCAQIPGVGCATSS